MQIDMHYYATYALARAAGINPKAAKTIATSAQFVDDNTAVDSVVFEKGARIDCEATAHHPFSGKNLEDRDQRRVWVPFHFIPGNEGSSYTEQLKCRKDSEIVREMCEHHLGYSDRAFALQLIGIAAHVYADTFSHYGFSGVGSRRNLVERDSIKPIKNNEGHEEQIEELGPEIYNYVFGKLHSFFEKRGEHGGLVDNIKKFVNKDLALDGALGHGSVGTLPDRPFLAWRFEYQKRKDSVHGKTSIRNNPATFLEGCRALHDLFQRFVELRHDDYGNNDGRDFDSIESKVREILLVQAPKEGRIKAWQDGVRTGEIFEHGQEGIPEYDGNAWNEEWNNLQSLGYKKAMDSPIWRFYQAASLHRNYVLRDLLPKHGLIVD